MKYSVVKVRNLGDYSEIKKNNSPTSVEWFIHLIKLDISDELYFLLIADFSNSCVLFSHFLPYNPNDTQMIAIVSTLFDEYGKPDLICEKIERNTERKSLTALTPMNVVVKLYPESSISRPYFREIITYTEKLINNFITENVKQKTNLNLFIKEDFRNKLEGLKFISDYYISLNQTEENIVFLNTNSPFLVFGGLIYLIQNQFKTLTDFKLNISSRFLMNSCSQMHDLFDSDFYYLDLKEFTLLFNFKILPYVVSRDLSLHFALLQVPHLNSLEEKIENLDNSFKNTKVLGDFVIKLQTVEEKLSALLLLLQPISDQINSKRSKKNASKMLASTDKLLQSGKSSIWGDTFELANFKELLIIVDLFHKSQNNYKISRNKVSLVFAIFTTLEPDEIVKISINDLKAIAAGKQVSFNFSKYGENFKDFMSSSIPQSDFLIQALGFVKNELELIFQTKQNTAYFADVSAGQLKRIIRRYKIEYENKFDKPKQ